MSEQPPGRPPPRLGAGRFLIIDALGEGGTAQVYLSWDSQEHSWCALKGMLHKHAQDDAMRRRFEQEAHTLELLHHPNIPQLRTWDGKCDPPFMVMELARCGSTMSWVRENGAMPCSMAADVMFQICEALAEAHAAGIVHRDVKPHNFLLDDEGHCKLTDFGIARVSENESLTVTGSQIGTFSFMAPEQRSDTKSVDHRADIYSLGASLYTLLTAKTSAELFVADKDDDLLEDVPSAFRNIVLTACRYRPEDRYDSALELQTALMNALSRIPPDQEDYPPLVRPRSPLPELPPDTLPVERRFEDLEAWGLRPVPPQTEPPAPGRKPGSSLSSGDQAIPYFMPLRTSTPAPEKVREGVPDYVDPSERGSLQRIADREHRARVEKEVQAEAQRQLTAEPPPVRHEEEEQDQRTVRMLTGLLAAAIALAVLLTVTIAVGMVQVSVARGEAAVAAGELTRTLEAQVSVVYEMGGDRRQFEVLYDTYRDARGAARVDAAVALVDALETAVNAGAPMDRSAEPKMQAIRAARADYGDAVAEWADAAGSFPGVIASTLGLAGRPPPH